MCVELMHKSAPALVAESGTPRSIVAHAAYVRDRGDSAEVAFVVADEWQGRGVSTILLAHLNDLRANFMSDSERPIYTLREFAGEKGDVEDPWLEGMDVWVACREEIKRLVPVIIDRLFEE